MSLPVLMSVPHAGLETPPEVAALSLLSPEEIAADGDEGASEVYALEHAVTRFITTDIARAFVDLNRSEDDRSPDGVVKTYTCWNVPIYQEPLNEEITEALLVRYYRPYHEELRRSARDVKLGLDCHTMAAHAPPIAPIPGEERPHLCLSNAHGTCPHEWLAIFASCLEQAFETEVSINEPFRGGHIIRSHAAELPWMQLELSRAPFLSDGDKRQRLQDSLEAWFTRV